MVKHKFGGDWTTDKLERIRKYLCAYTKIFKANPKAQFLETIYVDAFAGTGQRIDSSTAMEKGESLFALDADAETFKEGSARIALGVEPSFDQYVFIERNPKRADDLHRLVHEFPEKSAKIRIEAQEANAFLQSWCRERDWRRCRAVVFLDPYGMQVNWKTLEAVAATRAIDLWLLFPLGVAVNRLLTGAELPPAKWGNALTRIFGTEDWMATFYPPRKEQTLFGPESVCSKEARPDAIGRFFLQRLESIFAGVANRPLPLQNSRGTPIYLLCFAAGNPRGAPTAVKIAQDILKD